MDWLVPANGKPTFHFTEMGYLVGMIHTISWLSFSLIELRA